MTPLDALGLPPDADERAVKRAYAQRLKAARPDENPRAFQELRELYEAALVCVRLADSGARENAIERPPHRLEDPESTLADNAADRNDGAFVQERFSLDLQAFLAGMDAQIGSGDAGALTSWLAREMDEWPLAVRSMLSGHVLRHIHDTAPEISPAQLEAVIAAFGADDVMSRCDPLAVEMLRRRAVELGDLTRRRAKVAALLEPRNRGDLIDHMRARGQSGAAARIAARLLTSARAMGWARVASRTPFVTGRVLGFLRRLDDGRLNALPPTIAPDVLESWFKAEARNARGRLSPIGVFLMLLAMTYLATHGWNEGPVQNAREIAVVRIVEEANRRLAAGSFLSLVFKDDRAAGDLDAAIRGYDRVIRDPELVVTPSIEHAVALAYYNKAFALDHAQRKEAAASAYDDLVRAAGTFQNAMAKQLVVRGLVDRGKLAFATGAFDASYASYEEALQRFDKDPDAGLAPEIAGALFGQAQILARNGRTAEAGGRCDDTIRRFGHMTQPSVQETVKAARMLKQSLVGEPV